MRLHLPAAAACAALALAWGTAVPAVADSGPSVAFHISDPRITESSGLVASRLHKGVYWTHNDSGDGPYVYAVDSATGRTVARVTMRGIHARDVEAISMGPDGDLYVGDIGDNLNGAWPQVYLYRFPEPRDLVNQTVDVTRYTVRYADGPRNAEALMIQPNTGRVYIASKNEDGGHLYEGPAHLSASGVNVFHRIADVPWVTDGAFSPDGSRLVLRGYFWASAFRWSGDRPHKIGDVDLPMQPQGESVAFTPDGRALMYGSEGKDSAVWKEPLSGADLPADVAPSPSATPSAGTGGSAGKDADTTGKATTGTKATGFAILAAIGGAGYGLSRLLRSRRRRD
ncbi:hypothetical protein [Actinacidiphila guanduensis]|uniref:WD40 repeat domain-containing protein n=1 Tax=Actinacidiphila guanduensis TaxID=310781 RepID=A0A1H0FBU2_9ACTN|nr:hypothetical protein [Actinacidiphila guanduensis]SDN91962.1 hypothetical protein SAMN05216259_106229 [Actinacidiphila guanduensis]